MPTQATGEVSWVDGEARTRITLRGRERKTFKLPHCKTEDEANARSELLAQLAQRLRAVNASIERIRRTLEVIADATARELSKQLEAVEDLIGGKLEIPGASASRETVEKYAERWLESRKAKGLRDARGNDGGNDGSRLRVHVLPILRGKLIAEVSRDDVRAVVESLDQGAQEGRYSWQTAIKAWAVFSKMLADAAGSKVAALRVRDDNPALGVAKPDRGDKKSKQWLFPNEALALLSCPDVPRMWRETYCLCAYLFLRPGELFALDWDAVLLEAGYVDIREALDLTTGELGPPKTGKGRKVPIPPTLVPLLRAMHKRAGGKGRVIRAEDLPASARVMGVPEGLADILRAHLLLAGVVRKDLHEATATSKRVTFYDLRGTGITWAALAGVEPMKIMQRAGHETFNTTLGYIRCAEVVDVTVGEPFPPLDTALPGEMIAHALPTEHEKGRSPDSEKRPNSEWLRGPDLNRRPSGYECPQGVSQVPETTHFQQETERTDPPSAAIVKSGGSSLGEDDDDLKAKLDAVLRQAKAISTELWRRRDARAAAAGQGQVVDLEAVRKRRAKP